MRINNITIKVKCDISGCGNLATYGIESKGFFADKHLYICKGCIRSIYNWYAQKVVPKSPSNILNKSKKGVRDEG